MSVSRRDFLRSLLAVPAAALLPGTFVRAMVAPEGAGPRNLVLLDLKGGVDGLNLLVPYGLDGGLYGSLYRPTLKVPLGQVLPLGDAAGLGLHPGLAALKAHYDAGRLALVPGVGYPGFDFSHEVAQKIWQSGDPSGNTGSGWLARWMAQLAPSPAPVAAAIEGGPTQVLAGAPGFVPAFTKLSSFVFPFDSHHGADKQNRHDAYAAMAAGLAGAGGHLGAMSQTATGLLDLIEAFAALPEHVPVSDDWPEGQPASQLQLIVRLLAADSGMRYFHVPFDGFDTHADQELDGYFSNRLLRISQSLHAFWEELSALGLANDTLVVVFSEFGRTLHENGSAGSDHGTVTPVLVFGESVNGGVHGSHPSLDPDALEEHGELAYTTDFRDVFGTVVSRWLGGDAGAVFSGHGVSEIGFLP